MTDEGLSDAHLPAATEPVQFDAGRLGLIEYDPSGMAYLGRGLRRGDRYRAWSFEPDPTPKQLAASKPVYPQLISVQRKYLAVDTRAWTPPFGTPNRDAVINSLFADRYGLAAYRPLYRLARSVAGGAKSPYAAAVALESWFRVGGGFTYDQQPPRRARRRALVDFVTATRRGYCQHFAGAMALMLRYLGIPARVAAGFSSGNYDATRRVGGHRPRRARMGRGLVPRLGLGAVRPDSRPRRARRRVLVASSRAFDAVARRAVLAGKDGLRLLREQARPARIAAEVDPRPAPDVPDLKRQRARDAQESFPGSRAAAPARAVAGRRRSRSSALVKLAVRRSGYLTHDPRRLAAACRRELRAFLLDQRVDGLAERDARPSSASSCTTSSASRPDGFGLHADRCPLRAACRRGRSCARSCGARCATSPEPAAGARAAGSAHAA